MTDGARHPGTEGNRLEPASVHADGDVTATDDAGDRISLANFSETANERAAAFGMVL